MIKKICKTCGKIFSIYKSQINRKYCSPKCYISIPENNPNYGKHPNSSIKICEICGKKFRVKNSRIKKGEGKFCSRKCMGIDIYNKNLRGKNSPHWIPRIKKICQVCKKIYYILPGIEKRKTSKCCSFRCSGIYKKIHNTKKNTSIELAIEQELIKNSIPHIKQCPIEGIALVDFLLPNKIIIQADGKYWHSKEINKGKDIAQDTVLTFKGYKIYRFTEAEIKKSAKKCIQKVMEKGGVI